MASEEEVCSHWQGLGYYRRARNLRKAAVSLVENFKGKFPKEYNDLISIPGIGAYTANAIIAIGRDEAALALDANLERVFARVYGLKEEKGPKLLKSIQAREDEILKDFQLKKFGARAINESLMDLGRVYCQAKKADCLLCPIKEKCHVFKEAKNPLDFPLMKKKEKKMYELKLLRLIVTDKKNVIGYQKNDQEWLNGQVEIPTFTLYSEDRKLTQYPEITFENYEEELSIKTAITKYKIINYIVELTKKEFNQLMKANKISSKRYESYRLDPNAQHFSTATLKSFRVKSVL